METATKITPLMVPAHRPTPAVTTPIVRKQYVPRNPSIGKLLDPAVAAKLRKLAK